MGLLNSILRFFLNEHIESQDDYRDTVAKIKIPVDINYSSMTYESFFILGHGEYRAQSQSLEGIKEETIKILENIKSSIEDSSAGINRFDYEVEWVIHK